MSSRNTEKFIHVKVTLRQAHTPKTFDPDGVWGDMWKNRRRRWQKAMASVPAGTRVDFHVLWYPGGLDPDYRLYPNTPAGYRGANVHEIAILLSNCDTLPVKFLLAVGSRYTNLDGLCMPMGFERSGQRRITSLEFAGLSTGLSADYGCVFLHKEVAEVWPTGHS